MFLLPGVDALSCCKDFWFTDQFLGSIGNTLLGYKLYQHMFQNNTVNTQ